MRGICSWRAGRDGMVVAYACDYLLCQAAYSILTWLYLDNVCPSDALRYTSSGNSLLVFVLIVSINQH